MEYIEYIAPVIVQAFIFVERWNSGQKTLKGRVPASLDTEQDILLKELANNLIRENIELRYRLDSLQDRLETLEQPEEYYLDTLG